MSDKRPSLTVIEGGSETCVPAKPVLEDPTHFEVIQNGRVIGTVSARFDFSRLPDEHHQIVYSLVSKNRMRLRLPSDEPSEPAPVAKIPYIRQRGGVLLWIRRLMRMSS
jgi:hypothetical protein